ncbi:TIGR04282 family arsenosugar biosynthesis glycosyltransferase [sulfur-oxidizing endosymbiont of Gigantopelta aegis]|uniref:TIGR04282 family arsenosugar biosynthesis glycosyltransferase n=1 Tax=sulfur-oxidizing endosymbiont of Gigantopelta aegis TaxID=2794934 RepID=UPI0018DECC88|nr:TIGR04282 family arsenosugar biosynthesis glycosyltransferase [sulfur-oxidizing endosymbiont of Gigantopelta aegis]
MLTQPDALIIIFAREPVLGQVKTRLIPALGADRATELYKRLLDYTINNVISASLSPMRLCITPESEQQYFMQMKHAQHFELTVQEGTDLGLRMFNALATALAQYSKVILIGTDCPSIEQSLLQQAIDALEHNDMVFSPASDGGYVLIGAIRVVKEVFIDIDWGTDKVMQQSRLALAGSDLSWQELSVQHDVDIKADLKYLSLHDEFKDFIA